jgi:RNA polymerase sigma-70 factor (ECF subfamily)
MSIDHLRRRGRMPVFVATDELTEMGTQQVDERVRIKEPSEHASDSELGVLIRTAVDTLPEKQKAVFLLRHYQGFSLKEIAEIMGCTEGTIKTHLFRATGKLRHELENVRQDFMGR